jgi:hypothetical protein
MSGRARGELMVFWLAYPITLKGGPVTLTFVLEAVGLAWFFLLPGVLPAVVLLIFQGVGAFDAVSAYTREPFETILLALAYLRTLIAGMLIIGIVMLCKNETFEEVLQLPRGTSE